MASCEGMLWKKGKLRGSYKQRFFRLSGLTLQYFESPVAGSKQKGAIDLSTTAQFRLCRDPLKHRKAGTFYPYALELETTKRVWVLIPESAQDQEKWVDGLVDALPSSVVSGPLLEASRKRKAGSAKGSSKRGGRESKRRPADSDEDDSDVEAGWGAGAGNGAGAAGSAARGGGGAYSDDSDQDPASAGFGNEPRRTGFFSRKSGKKGNDLELTRTELATTRAEVDKLREENRQLQQALRKSGGKGKKGKGWGSRGEPLLGEHSDDDSDDDDKEGCCATCCATLKKRVNLFILFVVNLIILAMGCALSGVSAWAFKNHKHFAAVVPLSGIVIVGATGGVLILISIIGCVGAIRRNSWWARLLLYIYSIVLMVVIVLEVAAAALIFKMDGHFNNVKNKDVAKASSEIDRFINDTRQDCCAITGGNPKDVACKWIPSSILNTYNCATFVRFKKAILNFISSKIKPLAIICACVTVVELLTIYAACSLARDGKRNARKNKKSRDRERDRGRSSRSLNSGSSRSSPKKKSKSSSRRRFDSDSD